MNVDAIRKAAVERPELEYLFNDDQWVPAAIAQFQDSNVHSPYITIQLLTHPREHSGIIHLSTEDIKHRLRLKGSTV